MRCWENKMAKKSNKTEHVLSILTKKDGNKEATSENNSMEGNGLTFNIQANEVKVNTVKENTEEDYTKIPEKNDEINKPALEIQIKEELESLLNNEVIPEEEMNSIIKPIAPQKTSEITGTKTEENLQNTYEKEEREEKQEAREIEEFLHDDTGQRIAENDAIQDDFHEDLYYRNISELVLQDAVEDYMRKLSNCTCKRCYIDVVALSLTNLPSYYVASDHSAITFKKTAYSMKYRTEIMIAVTNACIIVNESPKHSK